MKNATRAVTNVAKAHPTRHEACSIPEVLGPFHESRSGWFVLAAVLAAAGVYLGANLSHGWIGSDGGTIGQMAERVLHSEVPYRDFIDMYTGGLDYVNAMSFWLFGANALSPRILLFIFFLGWVPSVYFIARRFVRPIAAGMVTLLAVAWSVPNYPEAMPSWYNLFFATWGVLALIRFTETERRRWLWIAGLTAGLSFLFKITSLYFVAAALLFFVHWEILRSREEAVKIGPSAAIPAGNARRFLREGLAYRIFASTGLLAFLGVVVKVIEVRPTFTDFFYFVLPCASLVGFLLREAWRGASDTNRRRFRRLLSIAWPFLAGTIVPIAMFLLWIGSQHALIPWAKGTFVLPMRRIAWTVMSPKSPVLLVGLLPMVLALWACHRNARSRKAVAGVTIIVLAVILGACWRSGLAFGFVGDSLPLLVPLGALGATFWLARGKEAAGRSRQRAFLVLSAAVVFSLIQFPFAAPAYFCYVAPLVVLALSAVLPSPDGLSQICVGALAVFYLSYAVWLRTPAYYGNLHLPTRPEKPLHFKRLAMPRAGGIHIPKAKAKEYEALFVAIHNHAHGPYIYAIMDCPQVYFLSGERNPTGTVWGERFDPDFFNSRLYTARILEAITQHGVTLVVLHNEPYMSESVPEILRAAIDVRFPRSDVIGDFELRWK